jgi:hypothetical protein
MANNAQDSISGRSGADGGASGAVRGGPTDRRRRFIFLRAIIWGLIGLIYAPLFIGLSALFEHLGAGPASFIAAAALAGGAGAVLYSGREVALLGAGVGVAVGVLSLVAAPQVVSFQHAAFGAAALAALIGLHPAFPARCDRQVPARVLVGVATGAFCGAVLAIAEPLHPRPFSIFAVLAFLVSVNGVLYVASVGHVLAMTRGLRLKFLPCNWVEALVTGSLAALAAGSVWMMAGPFLGDNGALLQVTSEAIYRDLPLALLGGIFGGSLAGALLAVFGFPWVHEV